MTNCALCRLDRELRESHIVPKFIFDYLKRTSATGYFRNALTPNRRSQDGRKIPLLCDECEQRFSAWERWFAEVVFRPYTEDRTAIIQYDGTLLKFATSLSWRVLTYYNVHGHLADVPTQHVPQIERALEVWRRFLLGELPHPGRYEQHILPMDELDSSTRPDLPTSINRYLLRSVDMDVVTGEKTAMVYTKLPRIAIVGAIVFPEPRNSWQGTRIGATAGAIRPRRYVVPKKFGDYMMGQAEKAAAVLAGMSDRQKDVVNQATLANLDRARASETMRAMARDVEMFGLAAFEQPPAEE